MKKKYRRAISRRVAELAHKVKTGNRQAEDELRLLLGKKEAHKALKKYVKDNSRTGSVKLSCKDKRKAYGPPLQGGTFGLGRSRKN